MEGLRPIWGCTLYKDPNFVLGFTVDTVLRLTGGVWYVECLCTYISIYECLVYNVYVHVCSCMVSVSVWYVMYVAHDLSVVWLCQL